MQWGQYRRRTRHILRRTKRRSRAGSRQLKKGAATHRLRMCVAWASVEEEELLVSSFCFLETFPRRLDFRKPKVDQCTGVR